MSPENIDPGATDFGSAKTEREGPRYAFLSQRRMNVACVRKRVKTQDNTPGAIPLGVPSRRGPP